MTGRRQPVTPITTRGKYRQLPQDHGLGGIWKRAQAWPEWSFCDMPSGGRPSGGHVCTACGPGEGYPASVMDSPVPPRPTEPRAAPPRSPRPRDARARRPAPGAALASRVESFRDLVRDSVERLERRWPQLADDRFPRHRGAASGRPQSAVERRVGAARQHGPGGQGRPARIVVYRRPVEIRTKNRDERAAAGARGRGRAGRRAAGADARRRWIRATARTDGRLQRARYGEAGPGGRSLGRRGTFGGQRLVAAVSSSAVPTDPAPPPVRTPSPGRPAASAP